MPSRRLHILTITAALVIALPFGMRQIFGRSRADLAAFFSIDDGTLWTFSRTYHDGRIGPFSIGESRQTLRARLLSAGLLEQEDKPQLFGTAPEWRFGLPAPIGGYIIYTIAFDGDRVGSVQSFYSAFAGL